MQRRQTDVEICYAADCINNNALLCDLIRVSITDTGVCKDYSTKALEVPAETTEETN